MCSTHNKDETARTLARSHFDVELGIGRIFRVISDDDDDEQAPVILLETNQNTAAMGIQGVRFGADPTVGIWHSSVIVEVTPDEYEEILNGNLKLPEGWRLGKEILPPKTADQSQE